jgi:hypothetical protein
MSPTSTVRCVGKYHDLREDEPTRKWLTKALIDTLSDAHEGRDLKQIDALREELRTLKHF